MSEFEVAYHKRWLGMLEPIDGLVLSVPVLVEAECMEKREAELSRQLADEAAALTRVIGKTSSGQDIRAIGHTAYEDGDISLLLNAVSERHVLETVAQVYRNAPSPSSAAFPPTSVALPPSREQTPARWVARVVPYAIEERKIEPNGSLGGASNT